MTKGDEGRRRFRWRRWLRAAHRDAGYLAVGLTLVYALSGIAVNHIADWDPNFSSYVERHPLGGALPAEDDAAAAVVLGRLGVEERPRDVYRPSPTQLEIVFDRRTLHVDTEAEVVVDEGQRPRPLLRVANWLHLNRGKRAWTVIADLYAVMLLGLALSGVFMIKGKKGIRGRGAVLVGVGVAVPVLYIALSGGP